METAYTEIIQELEKLIKKKSLTESEADRVLELKFKSIAREVVRREK